MHIRVNCPCRRPSRYDGGKGVAQRTRPVDRTVKRLQTTDRKPSENSLRQGIRFEAESISYPRDPGDRKRVPDVGSARRGLALIIRISTIACCLNDGRYTVVCMYVHIYMPPVCVYVPADSTRSYLASAVERGPRFDPRVAFASSWSR